MAKARKETHGDPRVNPGTWMVFLEITKQLSRTNRTSFIPPDLRRRLAVPIVGSVLKHHRRLLLDLNCISGNLEITIEVILCKYSRQSLRL